MARIWNLGTRWNVNLNRGFGVGSRGRSSRSEVLCVCGEFENERNSYLLHICTPFTIASHYLLSPIIYYHSPRFPPLIIPQDPSPLLSLNCETTHLRYAPPISHKMPPLPPSAPLPVGCDRHLSGIKELAESSPKTLQLSLSDQSQA